mgnify:CR=1 FL=1
MHDRSVMLIMDRNISTALDALESRNLEGIYAENRDEARIEVLRLIPQDGIVGIGDSTTVRQIGVIEALKRRRTKVLDGFEQGISKSLNLERVRNSTICDIFLTGTNAITLDGRLVNVDGYGNRIAGMFHGHAKSIIVVGRNKLVENLDGAFHRIRSLIAPNHIRIRSVDLGGVMRETPCVTAGICSDCRSRDRACNVFSIIEGKPGATDISVIIVDEDLGLAWDESWPKERISGIIEEYKKFVWIPEFK